MYQALLHRYAMYPGTVREMAYDGVLHRPPSYTPCGEFNAHYLGVLLCGWLTCNRCIVWVCI